MYYDYSSLIQNLQQMYGYLQTQQQRINQLELQIQELQSEMNTLKQNQTSNIEKIEYKFDQLKVERLEGTLNIGITPQNGENSIEDFAVHQGEFNVPPAPQHPPIFKNVQQRVHEYLNKSCYQDIDTIEKRLKYQLNNEYRQFIIEDIRKQIDQRIQHYLNQMKPHNLNQEQLAEIEELTFNKVKDDICRTYEEFVGNLPREEIDS
ncbi:spore germination protein GerPC [Halalkalibacter alkaliphilus]|uniref:Spore germination protein GerPC n=1 Tax=Halalkalibacter alkaliphilus TaxID=2917993 RepID=A0A9X2CUF1_9BACI|nr:spore germination protein GerPC [Halalkalibacter alkaliphilus]